MSQLNFTRSRGLYLQGDGGRGSHGHLDRHRRLGERQEGAAGVGPVSRRTSGEVPQVRHAAVPWCSFLWASWMR